MWLHGTASLLGISSYGVETLLNAAKSGASLEAITERYRAIRSAGTDPGRLERAYGPFSKVLEGERQIWPESGWAVAPADPIPKPETSSAFTTPPTSREDLVKKHHNRLKRRFRRGR